ncbi:prephenate dehydrogenase [Coraliomargarita akajimensis]|uniref:Prephenate dehydrogenase n=1 Tax=Coraliomargarita akajimensis (strain DSM 45221 / IAM 15411 / JCM 23193 / KCTC 12865 / 04OKA010-24) TaxID=583355 RepID=D5EMR4_CORAD|nr:prephenate dehydrogenase/arogenate dehydrogenase family protein [Coraliomargarita akajimensis]ADE55304.1 Prephenate dehydrogenase [Coraliomargarita akajimensis DSM 45221]
MFHQITILGPGLLGASLAMAAKERTLTQRIVTWSRREETRSKCMQRDWCDAVCSTASEAVRGSDLIIICTPVHTIVPLLKEIATSLEPGAIVTDVGSTKQVICETAQGVVPPPSHFIGSHPMAGSEQTGMEFAQADLFQGAACILTPMEQDDTDASDRLGQFWQALGMRLTTVSPRQHDEIVAHVSHLPHLLASNLCCYLDNKDSAWQELSGGGLRDSTRVASGDPSLWRQILEQNRDEVLGAIAGLENELQSFKQALVNQDGPSIQSFLERGKAYRDQLRK